MRTADSENGGPCFFLNIGAAVKPQVEFGLAVEEFAIAHSVPKFPRGQEKQMMEDNSEFGLFGRAIRTSQSRTKFVLASILGLALLIPCGSAQRITGQFIAGERITGAENFGWYGVARRATGQTSTDLNGDGKADFV